MERTLPILQCTLAAGLLLLAVAAAWRPQRLAALHAPLPRSGAGRWGIAILLSVAGAATLAGAAVPFLAFFGAVLGVLAALVLLVLSHGGPSAAHRWLAPTIAAACVGIAIGKPLGLQVLALPRADDLPVVRVPARVVKTYEQGLAFEGIAAASDGTLYLAANRGLDFGRKDYFHAAVGEIIERRTDGSERVVFRTERGSTAGVIAIGPDGTLYVTSHARESSVWRVDAAGRSNVVARFPRGAWPNGLAFGPDGLLYSADSALGVLWRVDPASGRAETAIDDALLRARPFIALAPGANGLHFQGRDLYVTVSDRTTVLKYAMDAQGAFGSATVVARGIPGDDFAIGCDGSLFVTTHPYDTVVRVRPDGRREVIGTAADRIVGATDAVLGTGPGDRDVLYVVTDGGAFTQGAAARGELVALQPEGRR